MGTESWWVGDYWGAEEERRLRPLVRASSPKVLKEPTVKPEGREMNEVNGELEKAEISRNPTTLNRKKYSKSKDLSLEGFAKILAEEEG